ncbi:ROK family protein [Streptomyces monticola]|uniref:ROK family protein n=1 Tax=Streptomyces monticola TaxID=2666263 RepID=A0ABW2JDN2_9ACTN
MAATPVLEVGGTHVTAALVAADGSGVHRRVRLPLDPHGSATRIIGTLVGCARLIPAPARAVWGVAVPGPFDYERGVGRFAGVGKFDALNGVDLRAALLGRLPQRPRDAVFLNDADAFLYGEWRAGAARGHGRCAGLTLGTGVGSAFLADGRIRDEGPGVPPEGRADLLRIDGRPLEESVSRRAIRDRYGDPDADVHDIAARARAGDARARRVLDEAFTGLGAVLAPFLAEFGASVLVVGGAMAHSWDLVRPALGSGLGTVRVELRRSALGADAALVGAAGRARPTEPEASGDLGHSGRSGGSGRAGRSGVTSP